MGLVCDLTNNVIHVGGLVTILESNPHLCVESEHTHLFAGTWNFVKTMDHIDHPERLVVEYINTLGIILKGQGILLVHLLPFRDFSYAVLLTQKSVFLIFGLSLQKSVRFAIFHDLRQMIPPPSMSEFIAGMETDQGWTDCMGVACPTGIMAPPSLERRLMIESAAQDMAARLAAVVKGRDKKATFDSLLREYNTLVCGGNVQQRGYVLQDLLNLTLAVCGITAFKSFTRNQGSEQIDGAFQLDGWHYLVECRWRKRLADIRQLDGLRGQIERSGKQTMGLFLSIKGWSKNACTLLKQNPDKSIILMDGEDLRGVLSRQVDLRDFLLAKAAALSFESEPFLGLAQYLRKLGAEEVHR